jgi:hypothetical protein
MRQTPPIVDAWLIDLSRRITSGSQAQQAKPGLIQNENVRLLVLGLLLLTAAGIIKPEVLIKFLPTLFKLVVGVGV